MFEVRFLQNNVSGLVWSGLFVLAWSGLAWSGLARSVLPALSAWPGRAAWLPGLAYLSACRSLVVSVFVSVGCLLQSGSLPRPY